MATRTISAVGGNWSSIGAWVEAAVPTSADDVVATALSAALTVDGTSGSPSFCRSANFTGYTQNFIHNASKFLKIGDGSGGSLTLVAGMTYVPSATSELHFISTTTGNTITTAGKTMGKLVFNGAGGGWTAQDNIFSGGNGTFTAGTLDALSGKTFRFTTSTFNGATVNMQGNMTLTGSMTASSGTINGNGFSILTAGATRNCSGVNINNLNSLTGGNLNLSAGTMTVVSLNASGTLNVTGANVTFQTLAEGLTATNIGGTGVLNTVTGGRIDSFGSITLSGTASITGNGYIDLSDGFDFTITSGSATLISIGTTSDGIYQNGGILTVGSGGTSILTYIGTSGTLNMGTGTWAINEPGDKIVWDATGVTVNASTSTIEITDVGTGYKQIYGGGNTYYNLKLDGGAASGKIYIFDANTFNNINMAPGTSLVLQSSKTQTVTTLTGGGSAGNLVYLTSDVPGTFATFALTTSAVLDYMSIQDNHVTPNSLAGSHSTNVSGNQGWFFADFFGGEYINIIRRRRR